MLKGGRVVKLGPGDSFAGRIEIVGLFGDPKNTAMNRKKNFFVGWGFTPSVAVEILVSIKHREGK